MLCQFVFLSVMQCIVSLATIKMGYLVQLSNCRTVNGGAIRLNFAFQGRQIQERGGKVGKEEEEREEKEVKEKGEKSEFIK